MQDHLYVMQAADGRVKIGRSIKPEERRRALETAAGLRLHLLIVVDGAGAREAKVHSALSAFRGVGEWFRNAPELWEGLTFLMGAVTPRVKPPKPRKPRRRTAPYVKQLDWGAGAQHDIDERRAINEFPVFVTKSEFRLAQKNLAFRASLIARRKPRSELPKQGIQPLSQGTCAVRSPAAA